MIAYFDLVFRILIDFLQFWLVYIGVGFCLFVEWEQRMVSTLFANQMHSKLILTNKFVLFNAFNEAIFRRNVLIIDILSLKAYLLFKAFLVLSISSRDFFSH